MKKVWVVVVVGPWHSAVRCFSAAGPVREGAETVAKPKKTQEAGGEGGTGQKFRHSSERNLTLPSGLPTFRSDVLAVTLEDVGGSAGQQGTIHSHIPPRQLPGPREKCASDRSATFEMGRRP